MDEPLQNTFTGRFTFATYELSLQGIPAVSNIEVSEGGTRYFEINPAAE